MTTATTISDTIRSQFPFEVEKYRLFGPDNMSTPHYGLFRDDTYECIGNAVSLGYHPHAVDDICALAGAAGAAFDAEPRLTCGFDNGHIVTVRPSNAYRRSVYGSDTVWPELVIRAGYDGRAFRAHLGMFRDACSNLLMIRPAGESVSRSIKHTSGLPDKVAELTELFAGLAAEWNGVVETAQAMHSKEIDLADFLRQVYPLPDDASDRSRTIHENRVETIVRRLWRERESLGMGVHGLNATGWEAFNAVQGYVQHEKTRRGRIDNLSRAVRSWDDNAVRRAYEYVTAV